MPLKEGAIVGYNGKAFTKEEINSIVIESIAVLLGEYNIYRKKAALLLLKAFLPGNVLKSIIEDDGIYPFDRNDPRVRLWTNAVIKYGKCERCGSKENLEAHHIIKWADYPKGRIDLNNGECLCHHCHTEEHRFDRSYDMMKSKQCKKR